MIDELDLEREKKKNKLDLSLSSSFHSLTPLLQFQVTVFHGSVLRGDLNAVRVGAGSTVGARCVLHAARSSPTGVRGNNAAW